MATPPGSETMPPSRPSIPNTGQVSRTNPQTESSTASSQIKNTQTHNSVYFKYTAYSPAAGVLSSTTNTDLATRAYRGNTVSYLHYLERTIKGIISKVDSYNHDLKNEVKLMNSKKSVYARKLDKKIQMLIAGKDSQICKDIVKTKKQLKDGQKSHARDLDKKLKLLNDSYVDAVKQFEDAKTEKDFTIGFLLTLIENLEAEEDSDYKIKVQAINKEQYELTLESSTRELDSISSRVDDLDKQIKLLNAQKDAQAEDVGRQVQLLSARKDSSARNLVRQVQALVVRKNTYAHDLGTRIDRFREKKAFCDLDIGREHELLDSKLAPFAGCLDRQLELLNSKLISSGRDFNKQRKQLDSIIKSYSNDVDNKMKLLNRDMTSCLGRDIQQIFGFSNRKTYLATPPGSGTMSPARPSTGQASRTIPQTESSATRSQIKNTQAHNSVYFKYTAYSPAAGVPSSTTNTDLATQAYRGNTVSYLHYLERTIKGIISKVDSYKHDLENDVKLMNSKKSLYAHDLDRRIELIVSSNPQRYKDFMIKIQQLKDEQQSHAYVIDRKVKLLNDSRAEVAEQIELLEIKVEAFNTKGYEFAIEGCTKELNITNSRADDLDNQIKLLNAEKDSHAKDLGRQIQLLSARTDAYAGNLVRRIQLLNARKHSFACDLADRIIRFREKKAVCDLDIGREHELLESKLAPFSGCLDRQLELLNSKLVSCGHDFKKQQNQLDSIITSFFLNVDNKMKLLKSGISDLEIDISKQSFPLAWYIHLNIIA